MTINGAEILSQVVYYNPSIFGFILIIILLICTIIGAGMLNNWDKSWLLLVIGGFGALCLLPFIFSDTPFLTQPCGIKYTIEILDDTAWKEIGPNYEVIDKPYENREIYIIKGDYIND